METNCKGINCKQCKHVMLDTSAGLPEYYCRLYQQYIWSVDDQWMYDMEEYEQLIDELEYDANRAPVLI